jgi:hypothetical protein
VPESFKVIRHVRPKFSCGRCETVIEAPAPSRPIPRSYAGPGLLAHVLVAKYCDHTPLNRQSEIYARDGVGLDRSTLAAGSALQPRCSHPWSTRCVLMCSRPAGFMPTTPPYRYSRRATENEDGTALDLCPRWPSLCRCCSACGLVRLLARPPRRTPADPFQGKLQADAYAGFHPLYEREGSSKPHAGRIRGASSTTSSPPPRRLPLPRPSGASACCTPSRDRYAEAHQRFDTQSDKHVPGL